MRKGCDGGGKKQEKKNREKKKKLMKIVATTSLPAVDRPNADRWNAARSCQFWKVKTAFWDEFKHFRRKTCVLQIKLTKR